MRFARRQVLSHSLRRPDRSGRLAFWGAAIAVGAIVALHDGYPVELQVLYPDLGVEEPIAAVVRRYDLDRARSKLRRARRWPRRITSSCSRLRPECRFA
jgi:hypothetical protein